MIEETVRNCNKIIFLLIGNLLFTFSMSFAAPAPYKKNVLILPFEDPPGWLGDNHPGLLVADLLKAKIIDDQNIILLNTQSSVKLKIPPDFLNEKFPSQIIVTGKILKFVSVFPDSLEGEGNPIVEVEVEFQIKDGHTHKILDTALFQRKILLNNISTPASDPLDPLSNQISETQMSKVLDQMTEKWIPQLRSYLNGVALAGQIIGIDQKNKIIVNLGRHNGVKIRDDFTVYKVTLNFKGGNQKINLGDRYTQLGVLRIKVVQDEFSEGVIVAGENFRAGNLIRSKRIKPAYLSVGKSDRTQTKPVDFTSQPILQHIPSNKSIRAKRTSFFTIDFFSLMGLSLEY